MSFQDLSNELVGTLPGLDPFLADTHIRRAWRSVCSKRLWSFLTVEGAIRCPRMVTAGTVEFTMLGTQITCNTVASAALRSSLNIPTDPSLLGMQIRFPGTGTTYQLYNIIAVDDNIPVSIVLTVDRPIQEPSSSNATYQCYRAYVTLPYTDVVRIVSFTDPVTGQPLKTDKTSAYFDLRDPQRQSMGLSAFVGANQTVQPGARIQRYELWPHSTSGQIFHVILQRTGTGMYTGADDELPQVIPDLLVMQRALGWHSYPFAMANPGHFPAMKAANWAYLIADAKKTFQEEYLDARREDDNIAVKSVLATGHGLRRVHWWGKGYPTPVIDAAWMQSHPIWW